MPSDASVKIKKRMHPGEPSDPAKQDLRCLTDSELASLWRYELRRVQRQYRSLLDALRRDTRLHLVLSEFRRRSHAYENSRTMYRHRHHTLLKRVR